MIQACITCVRAALVALIISATPVAAEDEFVFMLRAKGNPYWTKVATAIEESAHKRGIKATVYQSQSDTSAEEQLNACLTLIQRKPRFIALVATTTSVGIRCLKSAQERGISVAELDSTIPIAEAMKAGVKLAFSVGSDNYLIGELAAGFAAEQLSRRAGTVVVLEGAVGNEPGRQRVEGFTAAIKRTLPHVTIAASVAADWDRLKAMNLTLDLLARGSTIDVIFAANDLMALGAVEALKTKGSLASTAVIGVDGTEDALRSIKSGEMQATVAQVPELLGRRAVELAIERISSVGETHVETIKTPVVTRSSLGASSFLEADVQR
jgi:D-allose transport system substrate-binding protein